MHMFRPMKAASAVLGQELYVLMSLPLEHPVELETPFLFYSLWAELQT